MAADWPNVTTWFMSARVAIRDSVTTGIEWRIVVSKTVSVRRSHKESRLCPEDSDKDNTFD